MGFGIAGVIGNWIAGRVVDRGPTAASAGVAFVLMLAMAGASLAGGEVMLLLPLLAVWGAAHTAAFLVCQVRVMLAAPTAPAFASSLNIAACNLGIAAGAEAGGWVVDQHGIGAAGYGGGALAALRTRHGACDGAPRPALKGPAGSRQPHLGNASHC